MEVGGNMYNRRRLYGALAAALIFAVWGGCSDPLKPENGIAVSGGGGDEERPPAIPGSGGKAITLDKSKNDQPGEPGMRLFNISQGEVNAEEVTTQRSLGMWEDGKYHIEGYNTTFNGTYANAGFTDVSILYYNKPFPEEFKLSARVKIVRAGGVSTGKGIHVGAYASDRDNSMATDADGIEYQAFGSGQASKGMGLFLRAEATVNFRMYYSDQNASTTAGTGAIHSQLNVLRINKEYIYEVARVKIDPNGPFSETNAQYTFELLDSKTYLPVITAMVGNPPQLFKIPSLNLNATNHPIGNTTISMHPRLRQTVYAGVCISGSAAEISQIRVWDQGNVKWNYNDEDDPENTEPVFMTPKTIPAYVPADYIAIPISVPNKSPVTVGDEKNIHTWTDDILTNSFNWQQLINNNFTFNLDFSNTLVPSYADENIGFEFFRLTEPIENDPFAVTILEPMYNDEDIPSLPGKRVYKKMQFVFDPVNMTSGELTKIRFKVVARDLNLDRSDVDGEGVNALDYSQLQTLPEYYFGLNITKPAVTVTDIKLQITPNGGTITDTKPAYLETPVDTQPVNQKSYIINALIGQPGGGSNTTEYDLAITRVLSGGETGTLNELVINTAVTAGDPSRRLTTNVSANGTIRVVATSRGIMDNGYRDTASWDIKVGNN